MSPSILMLRLKDWNERRWKKFVCLVDVPSKSSSNSTTGLGIGEGVWKLPLLLLPARLFSVFLMRATHFFAGPLSSVPKTFPALRGTIS